MPPVSPVPTIPGALATVADFQKRYKLLAKNLTEEVIAESLVEATAHLEDRTSRRLAPFTNTIYEDRIWGIDPDEYGGQANIMPMSYAGSLGISYANAIGANDLSRHFWLPAYAPTYPELWTYTISSIELYLTYSSQQPILVTNLIGDSPSVSDGHIWLQLGTFSPPGSRIKVIYSGGYTKATPPSLKQACLMQTAKLTVFYAEQQNRADVHLEDLNEQLDILLAPWMRA